MAELVLLRHGQTQWSRAGRHTGGTDVELTPEGERQAERAGALLGGRAFALVLSSPLRRAYDTAVRALAATGGPGPADGQVPTDARLAEWDYGELEGVTTADWVADHPGWVLWRDGCPGGESVHDVARRVDSLLAERVLPALAGGDVLLVAHGHLLRVLTARYLGLPGAAGSHFVLDAGAICVLGAEHDIPAVLGWNRSLP